MVADWLSRAFDAMSEEDKIFLPQTNAEDFIFQLCENAANRPSSDLRPQASQLQDNKLQVASLPVFSTKCSDDVLETAAVRGNSDDAPK